MSPHAENGAQIGAHEPAPLKEGLLSGKVAIVTGGSEGIGRAIVQKFVEEGAFVYIVSRNKPENKEELGDNSRWGWHQGDVSQATTAEDVVLKATSNHGHVDILVNNAGVTRDGLLARMSEEDWDIVMNTNLKSAFFMTKEVLRPMMKQRNGVIINMASVAGQMGNPGQANYSASKAGLIALTETTSREYASRGIKAYAIAPGFVKTKMMEGLNEEQTKTIFDRALMKEPTKPEEIANLAVFLVTQESLSYTGQTFSPNGGLLMR